MHLFLKYYAPVFKGVVVLHCLGQRLRRFLGHLLHLVGEGRRGRLQYGDLLARDTVFNAWREGKNRQENEGEIMGKKGKRGIHIAMINEDDRKVWMG